MDKQKNTMIMAKQHPNSLANLRPAPPFTREVAQKLGKIGGETPSIKKSLAARLRELRKRVNSDGKRVFTKEIERKFIAMLENPHVFDLDILSVIQLAQSRASDSRDLARVGRVMNEFRKTLHGSKDRVQVSVGVDNRSVQVDVVRGLNFRILDVLRGFPDAERAVLKMLEEEEGGEPGVPVEGCVSDGTAEIAEFEESSSDSIGKKND